MLLPEKVDELRLIWKDECSHLPWTLHQDNSLSGTWQILSDRSLVDTVERKIFRERVEEGKGGRAQGCQLKTERQLERERPETHQRLVSSLRGAELRKSSAWSRTSDVELRRTQHASDKHFTLLRNRSISLSLAL